jgi:hypothetical protein
MDVPGMTVDQITLELERVEIERALERSKDGPKGFRAGILIGVQAEAERRKVSGGHMLIAKATHVHRHELGQFPAQVLNVDASSAVDVRREFVCEE